MAALSREVSKAAITDALEHTKAAQRTIKESLTERDVRWRVANRVEEALNALETALLTLDTPTDN